MRHSLSAVVVVVGLLVATALAPPAAAGTQDFTLVNGTGVEIYSLYLSETNNDSWEEDVLGDNVLPDGNRMNIRFAGRDACLWDMMVTDREGGSVIWQAINLCQSSVVVLRCANGECWAEFE